MVGVSGDPIEEYLARLRAQLRTPDADLVIAEAEDHLRESVAAGVAIGMTQREAQEAAISAFGSVRAVVRANRRPASAVAAEVGMAVWKLAAAYLLAVPVASVLLLIFFYQVLQIHTVSPGPAPDSLIITNGPPDMVTHIAGLSGSAIAGLALLLGYRRRCRSLRRRGQAPQPPLGAFFPLVAAIFMLLAGPAAGALIGPYLHLPGGTALLAASAVAASVLVALSDVAVMAVMIVRPGRDEEEARYAG